MRIKALVVHPSLPVRPTRELIALAKVIGLQPEQNRRHQ